MNRILFSLAVFFGLSLAALAANKGELTIKAIDRDTNQPLAVRMHLKDSRGKPVRPPKIPYYHDHFVFDGEITLELPLGSYTFEMEHGPEYKIRYGNFEIDRDAEDSKTVDLHRVVNMRKENWYAGDLHLTREPADLELLMRAEELDLAADVTSWNKKSLFDKKPAPKESQLSTPGNRWQYLFGARDERAGASLIFHRLTEPLKLEDAGKEFPGPFAIAQQAREHSPAFVCARSATLWDLPALVAGGQLDALIIASETFEREDLRSAPAWEKPREGSSFGGPANVGRWPQTVYFHLLNCGLRIAPAAGSGSGIAANPAGYNRAYVYCNEFTPDNWWQGLKEGRTVITNGPLLRLLVNGMPPGHVFQAESGVVELSIALNLATREKIEYLEVIQDGRVVHETRLDELAKAGGKLPGVKFERSGWMAVRAVTNAQKTYRFALTAPYYVEIGYKPTVSKKSAQFFLDWLTERARRITLTDGDERQAVMTPIRAARDFWQQKVNEANAE
ncbi:CehA/McbA family metallohydrolase [Anatilimnocola floriformis]|uniref:CehA/McbA family metallohydrolase n=1 Tax=Anatilimnocola floriformis TaxID=2948575 RepID=UPI0020C536EE|nr:CehA/McbA family metallohydrolase [Anatilimnocola floriformis]